MRICIFCLGYRSDEFPDAFSSFTSQRVDSALAVHQQVKNHMFSCHRTVHNPSPLQAILNDISAGAVDWTIRLADSRSRAR